MASQWQEWKVDEPYLNLHCSLGEGPSYEKATNSLRFVDIIQKKVHTVFLDKGPSSVVTLTLDSPVGVTADIEGVDPQEKILVGLKYGLAVLDRKTGKYEYVAKYNDTPKERLRGNDGAADPNGKFWIGSMTDFPYGDVLDEGSLYRFDGAKRTEVLQGLKIPNSIGWSPDNKTMYFTHTTAAEVIAFDYDAATGAATNQRVFYRHAGTGGIDGFRVDVHGDIWHAIYGEARVIKISGRDGALVGEIKLPTKNITCVEFVGTELFITTANDDKAEGGARSKELGGALYRVDVGVKGLPVYAAKL